MSEGTNGSMSCSWYIYLCRGHPQHSLTPSFLPSFSSSFLTQRENGPTPRGRASWPGPVQDGSVQIWGEEVPLHLIRERWHDEERRMKQDRGANVINEPFQGREGKRERERNESRKNRSVKKRWRGESGPSFDS